MKALMALLAAGTAYYFTSRVYITGPSDWGALQPGSLYSQDYAVSASASPLLRVTAGGDPEFSIDDSACPGVRSCVATVAFMANVGGDYSGTIIGTSSSVGTRTRGSSTAKPISVHVVGANYSLSGYDNGDSTATFTVDSTGESDLTGLSFAASSLNGTATIAENLCGDTVPSGVSCTVRVAFDLPPEGFATYGYVFLQAFGNTRQQDPVRVTLVLPPVPDRALLDGPTPIIVD